MKRRPYQSSSALHPNTIPAAEAEKVTGEEGQVGPVAAVLVVMAAAMAVPAVAGDTVPAAVVQVVTAAVTVITAVAIAAARNFKLLQKAIPATLRGPAPASPLTTRRGQ